ncbi:MAG: DNA mismatch repair endonuclease MutL [Bacteroidetes bacterium]|nr:DNA mismatch repair endonuclease MutL [Bacteroidota bacterium]
MSPTRIQLMPEALANQIAAGEVVQRPASAVKELLENALDAGASHIRLAVQDAGKKLIQVIDNGSGMGPTDARMCFERHATSKIRTLDDLFRIQTMGFRGEALASIAAVAQVELKTRPPEEELGTQVLIAGGEFQGQQSVQTAAGTILSVRNLFFNVPARRNFLKSNPVEFRHILTEFYHVALARPDVHFVLDNNSTTELDLPPADLAERYVQLHSPLTAKDLAPLAADHDGITLGGWIGTPHVARKLRGQQYVFVNGRFIRSPLIHHAMITGYGETLPAGLHPAYILTLRLDPSRIDINIHPTKTEIQFQDEREVYALVLEAVRRALGGWHLTAATPGSSASTGDPLPAERTGFLREIYGGAPPRTEYRDSPTLGQFRAQQQQAPPAGFDWRELYPPQLHSGGAPVPTQAASPAQLFPTEQEYPPVVRISARYATVQRAEGFYLLDLERAHRRVLYERFLAQASTGNLAAQQLLYPITLEYGQEDFLLLKEAQPELQRMGFRLTASAGQGVVISGTPFAGQTEEELRLLLDGLLSLLKESGELQDTVRETVARSLARRQGLTVSQHLSPSELQHLVSQLFACQQPAYTPSGEPVWYFTPWDALDKLFEKR